MTKTLFSIGAMIAAFTLLTSAAHATTTDFHGTMCKPDAADAAKVSYNQYGINNTSPTDTVTVHCPFVLTGGATISQVTVYAYDRNSTTNVSCTLHILDHGGVDKVTPAVSNNTTGSSSTIMSFALTPSSTTSNSDYMSCSIPPNVSGFSAVPSYEVSWS